MHSKDTGDGNPGYLPPEPKIKAANKKVLMAVIIVISAMLMLLMFSISGEDERPAEEARRELPLDETANKPLTSPVEGFGLAFEEESRPTREESEKIIIAGPPPVDREAEARLRESEEIRRRQFAAEQNAYSAPMLVKREVNSQAATNIPPEYTAERPVAAPYVSASASPDAYDPAAARDREGFLERAENRQWSLPYTREAGREFELKTGAVIPGAMVGGINSDLPGSIIGQVSQNVYDTATGRALLIPQGSKIYGVYDSRVIYGQKRVLIAWNRLIFPDGSSITLGAMPGADVSGYAGFEDQVDNHYFRIFGSAVLMSLIGGGMSYAVDRVSGNGTDSESDQTTMQDEMTSALAAQLGQTTLQLLQKNLNISPTLRIRPGYQFNIMVTRDIIFGGPYAAQ